IIILWPGNADMGRDPYPLQHTVSRITRHRGGNGHRHMARNIFPLAPRTGMVRARAVHPFPNLDLLFRVRGIYKERLTQSDVISPVPEQKFELEGTRVDLGEL